MNSLRKKIGLESAFIQKLSETLRHQNLHFMSVFGYGWLDRFVMMSDVLDFRFLIVMIQFFRIKYQIGELIADPIIIRPMTLYTTCRIEIRDFYLFLMLSSDRLHFSRK